MTTDKKVVQILRTKLLRPLRVHLRSGRSFIVRAADAILSGREEFIVARRRPKGAFSVYMEEGG
jgi:hypothetical protein